MPYQSADIPGARESNAGDEFHVLWATRRMLGLLDPVSDLSLVAMEDLHPATLEGVHPSQLLGVDLTEYYGGDSLDSASSVVVSQLKYSPRHPQTPWTAARLAERRATRNKSSSVIGRLADVYAALASQVDRKELLAKLSIRLISNQPAGAQLTSALAAARAWLERRDRPANKASLLSALDARDRGEVERVIDASGLRSRDATDFLRVFRLDVGQDSRGAQDLALTETLAAHVGSDLEYHSLALKQLVRDRALPEGRGQPIRREDVLARLHVPGMDALLPARPHFARPAVTLPTPDPARILAALDASTDRRVVAHGGAGVGKTTTILALEETLPPGSVVIAFDCFAAGEYVTQAQARHTPQRALMQLSNELAVRCRLPMLVVRPADDADLWRAFQRRLDGAAARMADASARLVVVIDAADNSVWAARRRGEASFVPDLWDLRIPECAALIVTARTARLDEIQAPPDVATVELAGFDEAASADYLRRRFPDADDEQARTFHEGSAGNPRVQFYVLNEARAASAKSAEEAVEQAKKTPEDIFDDLWSAAVEQALDREQARVLLADLLCLSKPTTVAQLAAVAGRSVSDARRFAAALYPGLRIDGDAMALRDEDFEHYLKAKFTDEEFRDAHARLAGTFEVMQDDPYAAVVLAGHLFQAGEHDRLLDLAVKGGAPEVITDRVWRTRVYRERLRYALRVAADARRDLDATKLIALTAQVAKSDRAMARVILAHPSLALRHGDREVASVIWNDDRNVVWFGPVHMHLAAASARLGDHDLAADHLRHAAAWMERRREEENRWRLEAADAAAACESVRLRDGWEAGIREVTRWRPVEFMAEVGVALMQTAIDEDEAASAGEAVAAAPLPAQVKARMLAACPVPPAEGAVRPVATALIARPTRAAHLNESWPVAFCELAARTTNDAELVAALLTVLPVERPRFAPHRWERLGDHESFLRAQALQAEIDGRTLTIDELMPRSVIEPDSSPGRGTERVESERRATREAVAPFLPIFALRARALLRAPQPGEVRGELRRQLREWTGAVSRRWYEPNRGYAIWAQAVCDVAAATRGSLRPELRDAANAATSVAAQSFVWQSMAGVAIRDPRHRGLATVWIERAATAAQGRPQQARELADFLLSLAQMCDRHDDELAGDLYNRAIAAAEDVDDEEIGRLEMHMAVGAGLAHTDGAPVLAERMARAVELCAPRVSDEEMLPWGRTAERITEIHPPTGLALMTRWEDMRHVRLDEGVQAVLVAAIRGGLLTLDDGVALLSLLGDGTAAGSLITTLLDVAVAGGDPVGTSRTIEAIGLRIRRDLQPGPRAGAAATVIAWARGHALDDSAAVRALAPYTRKGDDEPQDFPHMVPDAQDPEEDEPLDELSDLSGRLEASWRSPRAAEAVADVLAELVSDVAPARRVDVLDALISLSATHPVMHFELEEVLRTIRRALEEWSQTPAVAAWRRERLPGFLRAQLDNASRYDGRRGWLLDVIGDLAGDQTTPIIVDGVAERIDRFSPEGLYGLASTVGRSLDAAARRELLAWSLGALDGELPDPAVVEETSRPEVLAAIFWALFGHPEKEIRWRAAHAARAVIGAGDFETASALLDRTARLDGGRYVDARLLFYWMSARVWAHMTLARVAGDAPGVLAGLAGRLAAVALDTVWPHAAVREFARRGALRVAPVAEAPLDDQLVERLRFANRPAACLAERRSHHGRTGSGNRGLERLHFGIDTLPYWYGPLGARFGLGPDDVARLAEEWIIDRLALAGLRSSDERDPRLANLDYSEFSDHHGTLPRVESAQLTIDYHAMLLVAGALLDERTPIVVEPYDDAPDPWEEWMERHIDASLEAWTVDVRCSPPPERGVLSVELVDNRWPEVRDADFARMLGPNSTREMIVASAVHYSSRAGYGWDRVASALVSPKTAPSLLRALTTAEDASVLSLPYVPPDPAYPDDEIDSGNFRLKGWLVERRQDRDGIERDDRLARIGLTTILPGPAFQIRHRAVPDRAATRLVDSAGVKLAWVRTFSDEPPPRPSHRDRAYYADGWETFVDAKALLDFLAAEEMMLILKMEATRSEWSEHEPRPTENRESHRVLLIEPDGTIRGFRPDH